VSTQLPPVLLGVGWTHHRTFSVWQALCKIVSLDSSPRRQNHVIVKFQDENTKRYYFPVESVVDNEHPDDEFHMANGLSDNESVISDSEDGVEDQSGVLDEDEEGPSATLVNGGTAAQPGPRKKKGPRTENT
jgi:hypothetical protein